MATDMVPAAASDTLRTLAASGRPDGRSLLRHGQDCRSVLLTQRATDSP